MPSDLRLHPWSVLFGVAKEVRNLALPGLAALVTAGSAGWNWQAWAMLLIIPLGVASLARYLTFRYRYDAKEIVIRSGILFRNERHLPYARIHNVDAVQNVLHRLLGVVEVRVETGGGDEPEAKLAVLPTTAFEEMRRRVLEARAQTVAPTAPAESEPAPRRIVLELSPRELALYGVIENRGTVIVAAAFGALWEIGLLEGVMDGGYVEQATQRGLARDVAAAFLGRGGLPVGRIALALLAFVGLLLAVRLFSMVWAIVRLHGFRLSRDGEDLRTDYGLLTRVQAAVPRRRIQSLSIREGPLHRLFGRVSVRVDTAGSPGSDERATRREWLAPILRRNELPALAREILPDLDLARVEWRSAPPRAFRRVLKEYLIVAFVVALPFILVLRWWELALVAALVGWAFVAARRYVAHLGWAITGSAVLFRSGWLWRNVSVARFAKIQAVALHESPFDRRAAMARVRVDTAGAGDLSHRVDIPYLPREIARELCTRLATAAEQTAFEW